MKIGLLVEGKTEVAFLPSLREYLAIHLAGKMPNIDVVPYDGRIPTGEKLKRIVELLLRGTKPADHVIALTDVYTGTMPPKFVDASDAKLKMRQWVGNEPRFHPHVAQHDFEAWLLPYWPTIQRLAQHNVGQPGGNPEMVNHGNPPAHRITEIFKNGKCSHCYVKPRDALRILRGNDLATAVAQCAELKAFINTIIVQCGGNAV